MPKLVFQGFVCMEMDENFICQPAQTHTHARAHVPFKHTDFCTLTIGCTGQILWNWRVLGYSPYFTDIYTYHFYSLKQTSICIRFSNFPSFPSVRIIFLIASMTAICLAKGITPSVIYFSECMELLPQSFDTSCVLIISFGTRVFFSNKFWCRIFYLYFSLQSFFTSGLSFRLFY